MSQPFMSSRKRSSGCGWNNSTAASSSGAPTIQNGNEQSTDNDIHTCTPDEVTPKTFDLRGGRQQAKPDVGRPLDGRVRPQWATHGDWGSSSRLRSQRPADSCGSTKTGLNDQAVERGDDKDIETT